MVGRDDWKIDEGGTASTLPVTCCDNNYDVDNFVVVGKFIIVPECRLAIWYMTSNAYANSSLRKQKFIGNKKHFWRSLDAVSYTHLYEAAS